MASTVAVLCGGTVLVLISLLAPEAFAVGQYSRLVSYQGEIVVRCPDKNKATVQVLRDHSDVWHIGQESIDMRVKGSAYARVQNYFPECSVVVEDLEAHVQSAESKMFPQKKAEQEAWLQTVVQAVLPKGGDLRDCEAKIEEWEAKMQSDKSWFDEYHNYDAIVTWYKALRTAHPQLLRIESIGHSAEGRDMPCIHFTGLPKNSQQPAKKKFYIQCQIHAREWISGAVCMYLVNHFVRGYENDQRIQKLMDNLEFVLVPFVNPDGYVYTWTADRMWRKNRRALGGGCVGVDINRNFPEGFKYKSMDRCEDEDYGGPRPLSEIETRNIVRNFRANAPIIGSIDMHSYGELILRPWGQSNDTTPDDAFHRRVGSTMVQFIREVHGTEYTSETSHDLYYCYGIAADWFYSADASKTNDGYRSASLCIELRSDSNGPGFLLPADQILPSAEEVLPGILHYIDATLESPLKYTPPSSSSDTLFAAYRNTPLRHTR